MNSRTRPLLPLVLAVAIAAAAACAAPGGTTAAPPLAPTVRLPVTAQAQTPTPSLSPSAPTSTLTRAAAHSDYPGPDTAVEQLAVAWLVAYLTAGFTSAADAWIDRTTPYVTDQLAAQNNHLRADGRGPGVAWQDFVDRRCTSRVVDAAAVVPPEAPRTDDTVHVQAAGILRTSCATGGDPPDEALAVTLTAVRTETGWRIASRDY